MEFILVVTRPFGTFRRGDVIENMTMIEEILRDERASFVVRVAASVQSGA